MLVVVEADLVDLLGSSATTVAAVPEQAEGPAIGARSRASGCHRGSDRADLTARPAAGRASWRAMPRGCRRDLARRRPRPLLRLTADADPPGPGGQFRPGAARLDPPRSSARPSSTVPRRRPDQPWWWLTRRPSLCREALPACATMHGSTQTPRSDQVLERSFRLVQCRSLGTRRHGGVRSGHVRGLDQRLVSPSRAQVSLVEVTPARSRASSVAFRRREILAMRRGASRLEDTRKYGTTPSCAYTLTVWTPRAAS